MPTIERYDRQFWQKVYHCPGAPKSYCECCNNLMQDHDWADVDPDGFVVNCSNVSLEK